MKITSFDAWVDFVLPEQAEIFNTSFVFGEHRVPSSFSFYEGENPAGGEERFIHVTMSQAEDLKWGDAFEVLNMEGSGVLGKGTVLFPSAQTPAGGKKATQKRKDLLRCLSGSESRMLEAFTLEKGIKGLGEREILELTPLSGKILASLSQKLEAQGQIRILSFSPLFLLSQSGFEFLCEKILAFLQRFHETHPDERGAPIDAVKKKFDLPPRVYSLALGHLFREGKICEKENCLVLADFKLALTPDEEALLDKMEEMYLEGKLYSVSMEDLQKRFRLSVKRLENLLSLLTERRKIVKGKDGFILHSQWLNELAARIRNSGKTELSVGDFKEMTGLSRKYAIPLLELLDQMGITRRRGPIREILK
jgi:selenocysteine-specific elongation factor